MSAVSETTSFPGAPASPTATVPAAQATPSQHKLLNSNMSSSTSTVNETPRLNDTQAADLAAPASAEISLERSAMAVDAQNGKTTDGKEEARTGADGPLPANLKIILAEVAKTGSCSWLCWNTKPTTKSSFLDVKEARAAASSCFAVATAAEQATMTAIQNGKSPGAATSTTATISSSTTSSRINSTKYASGVTIPANRGQNRWPYTTHFNAAGVVPNAGRSTHRNGVKVSRRRSKESKTQTRTTGGRKRPLFLIRTSASGASGGALSVTGSVGSGRTSGSEPDDSTQYECDSEGTSATSCSELSTERREHHLRNIQRVAIPVTNKAPCVAADEMPASPEDCHCLKDVLRLSLGLVLDHWFRHHGGYQLSPAEKRRSTTANPEKTTPNNAVPFKMNGESESRQHSTNTDALFNPNTTTSQSSGNSTMSDPKKKESSNSPEKTASKPLPLQVQSLTDSKKDLSVSVAEEIFSQRKERLLLMLGQMENNNKAGASSSNSVNNQKLQVIDDDGPPFTIQRIAEVLMAPQRYYTQTHKLCNCLEKLLLVKSSASAFGGSIGGVTSQSRLEERELAALANERERLESEFRERAQKRRHSALSDDVHVDESASPRSPEAHITGVRNIDLSPENKEEGDNAGSKSSSREMLEAAARSLRTKFDHVGIDPHSSGAVANRDVRSIAENRGMTNSPPPPSLGMSGAAGPNISLSGHTAVGNFVRQHLPEQNGEHGHQSIARVPSPILFSQSNESSSIGSPLHAAPNMQLLHMHHPTPSLGGVSMGSPPFDVVTTQTGGGGVPAPKGPDSEGRSSASNSDVDSESDDVSFDDSASDRSDGSDSGQHYEPFTAARAMALNRIQQQRLQSRALTALALHQSEGGFRLPADAEYQSGDSIDSTRGEDSGGSDSSSSDVAD